MMSSTSILAAGYQECACERIIFCGLLDRNRVKVGANSPNVPQEAKSPFAPGPTKGRRIPPRKARASRRRKCAADCFRAVAPVVHLFDYNASAMEFMGPTATVLVGFG